MRQRWMNRGCSCGEQVLSGGKSLVRVVYMYVFGCVCPTETHLGQHACKRPGHRPEENTFVISSDLNWPGL